MYENEIIHSVMLEGNSIVLFEGCFDCFQHNYLKRILYENFSICRKQQQRVNKP